MDNCGADLEEIAESTDNGRTNLIGRAPLGLLTIGEGLKQLALRRYMDEVHIVTNLTCDFTPSPVSQSHSFPSTYPIEMPNTISATCGVAQLEDQFLHLRIPGKTASSAGNVEMQLYVLSISLSHIY